MNKLVTVALLALGALAPAMARAGTTGALRGAVIHSETAEPLAGVTVIATSPALQGEEATLTDDQGRYTITGLPPGSYRLRFEFAGAATDRNNVAVSVDKTITVNVELSTAAVQGEVYTIDEVAPSVDVASTTTGITVTKEFIENVPQGRSRNFEETMRVSPSATVDNYGVSISGATSPENSYVIDGLNTTDPAMGLLGSRLVLDFVEELEIKEGGYGAEYGRATGGLVNVVTKSGSNELHGTVFAFYRPGFMEASRKLVIRAGESIGSRRALGYYLNAGFEVGGPIVKDKLWFHVGYAPEIQSDRWHRDIYAREDDPDGSGPLFDRYGTAVTHKVASDAFDSLGIVHQYRLKLTHAIDDDNRHALAVNGAPSFFNGARRNDFDPNTPSISMNGDPQTFKFDDRAGNLDGIYKYAGKFNNDKLQVEAWLGYHTQKRVYEPSSDAARNQPLIVYLYPRNLKDAQSAEVGTPSECDGTLDDGSPPCVVDGYAKGGFGQGLVARRKLERFTQKAAVTHLFDFGGLHQVKYGLDFEQNVYHSTRWYTGKGFYYAREDQNAEGVEVPYFQGQEYFAGGDASTPAPELVGKTQSHNWALFLQDSWNPTPTFTLNYGLRWEAQEFYGIKVNEDLSRTQEKKFGIYDNYAPRLGAMWDFLGNGRSKLFAHWGRFYESIPLDLMDRGFAGEGMMRSYLGAELAADGYPVAGTQCHDAAGNPITKEQVTDPRAQCKNGGQYVFGGSDSFVQPGLKGQYSEETLLGVEVELLPTWVMGMTGIYRTLESVIENISIDDGNAFLVANPGQFDRNRIDDLDRQIAKETDADKRARLELLRSQVALVNDFPKARRELYGLEFKIDKKLTKAFLVRGSYLWSWTYGNYPGLYQDNTLQLDPNGTSMYDLPSLLVNRTGYLPSDRRHRIKVDGYYQANLRDFGLGVPVLATLGAAFRVTSGKPIDVVGYDPIYGTDEAFLLPRGAGGRTPWTWAGDLHVGVRYMFDQTMGAELFVDLFNVTNNQQTTEVDSRYTADTVLPIKNGTTKDLPYAVTTSGQPVRKNPSYGRPTQYQLPFSGQLGARMFF
ncbi:MAG: TonB-dependent receptor [Deltaproteobacteria bacterium]|nr:TonB-dependent receptor [Deltaproteobacteria bacterium]